MVTIASTILSGLANGQATLPQLAPKSHAVSRYIEARKLEDRGVIVRVGTIRPAGQKGGPRRIVWRLA